MKNNQKLDLAVEKIRAILHNAAPLADSEISDSYSAVNLVLSVSNLIKKLELSALDILEEANANNKDDLAYLRVVADFAKLQENFSFIRNYVWNKQDFIDILKNKGQDVGSVKKHLEFLFSLDQVLEKTLILLQYDEKKKIKINVKMGYEFRNGSSVYSRIYFNPNRKM